MHARLQAVEQTWAAGLKTHALQPGTFRSGPADQLQKWQLGDAGPAEGEEGFLDVECWVMFSAAAGRWHEAEQQLDVDGMWAALESTIVRCHQLRSGTFQQPRAKTQLAAEEP